MAKEIESIARAIKSLGNEHGLPNRFAIHEIADIAGVQNFRAGYCAAFKLAELEAAAGLTLSYEPKVDGYSWIHAEARG